MYLFRLRPDADFQPLVPGPDYVLAAWVDENGGLHPLPPDEAIQRCLAAAAIPANRWTARRWTMARVVTFTAIPTDEETVAVRLLSRALHFAPRGTREAHETWQRTADGQWYSAYRPHPPTSSPSDE